VRPGGTLAVFWSYQLLDDKVAALFQRIYDEPASNETQLRTAPGTGASRVESAAILIEFVAAPLPEDISSRPC
jgi:hypothetical protein